MQNILKATSLLVLSLETNAQFGPTGGDNPYYPDGGDRPYSNGGGDENFPSTGLEFSASDKSRIITIHAILATVAFGLLLPLGGIIIRLGSFRGVWLVHGLLQTVAYIVFAVAFAIGIYMFKHMPSELPNGVRIALEAHPIIGMALFGVLFLQPLLGIIHHFMFKRYNRRTLWSHAHLWIGRTAITVGIINGGLGLRLSKIIGKYAPPKYAVVVYAVTVGLIYILYVLSAVYGEVKRRRLRDATVETSPLAIKSERSSRQDFSRENVRYG